jgi:hypothetical protein
MFFFCLFFLFLEGHKNSNVQRMKRRGTHVDNSLNFSWPRSKRHRQRRRKKSFTPWLTIHLKCKGNPLYNWLYFAASSQNSGTATRANRPPPFPLYLAPLVHIKFNIITFRFSLAALLCRRSGFYVLHDMTSLLQQFKLNVYLRNGITFWISLLIHVVIDKGKSLFVLI